MIRYQGTSIGFLIITVVLLCLASSSASQPCDDYRHDLRICGTTELGFAATAVALVDGVAYVAGEDHLAAWNVGNPGAPQFLDGVALTTPPLGIAVAGHVVCVRDASRISVIDASAPATLGDPVVVGPIVGLRDIAVGDGLLLVASEVSGLLIYDVADPAAPHLVGHYDSPGEAVAVALRGHHALVADTSALLVIDVADPVSPALISAFSQPATPDQHDPAFLDVIATATGAAVSTMQGVDHILNQYILIGLDLADPQTPTQFAQNVGPTDFDGALGDLLLSRSTDCLEIWTCSPQLRIAKNAVVPWAGTGGMVAASADVGCAVNGAGQMLLVDARYPGFVMPSSRLDPGSMAKSWMISRTTTYEGVGDMTVRLIDLSDPLHPQVRDEAHHPGAVYAGGAFNLRTWGDRVAWNVWDGTYDWTRIADFSVDPPAFGNIQQTTTLAVSGERAYGLGRSLYIPIVRIYDITDVASPVLLGSLPGSGSATLLALTPDIVLVPDSPSGIKIYDCANAASPQVIGTVPVPGSPQWWRQDGDLVFVGLSGPALAILDVSDLRVPVITYVESTPGLPTDVIRHGNLAVVALAGAGLQIYDLEGGSGVEHLGPLVAVPGVSSNRLGDVVWAEDVLYVAAGDAGLLAFDVQDPANPEFLGAGNVADGVYPGPGVVLVPEAVMPLHCAAPVSVGDDDAPRPGGLQLSVAPNPFNPRTTLHFQVTHDGIVELALFDLAGHRVRSLHQDPMRAGDHAITWNGCDDTGRALPSGVYLARVRAGADKASARLVLLK